MIRKRSAKENAYTEDIKLNWTRVSENNEKFYVSQYKCSIFQKKYHYEVYLQGQQIVTNILSLEAAKLIANIVVNDYVLHASRIDKKPKI
jgi:hypothetical protein